MIRCTDGDVRFRKSPDAIRGWGSPVFIGSEELPASTSSEVTVEWSGAADSVVKRSPMIGSLLVASSERYIASLSSNSQSGLIRGKRSRILRNRSYPGLLRPEIIWEILEAPVPKISARRLEVKPSCFINSTNFPPITRIFYKYKHFYFVKQVKSKNVNNQQDEKLFTIVNHPKQ